MQVELDSKTMPKIPGAKVAILQAKWYREPLNRMVQKTIDLLVEAECPKPEVHILPGSLELPLAAQALMRTEKYDAIICFGAIMKGETYHFDMIMNMCAEGFNRVMLEEGVPIIMEVLPISSNEQLEARSQDNSFNKGIEAAMATAEIIDWRRRNLSK
ncbi:6,7-dimethyl-8-ribityllumazine synthase [Candidatus Uhrbacteria bacterium CG10_big_fil_rev_8_21_14_0_10_48_16]|uniref:6,7-dimethyl-8-ribityllumazine synthase n=1 Tax=Candidatus Uhrbacteria bacterium CG10_big_fil_rev_8_21_14_0_10_48_16 TaxID=1975038 RepID=A0A2M8LGR2_9BACT|nr:MAG: 6,7-dimethyl-8-ribityllumazine synthase [Candidatus Uhrbacteria bacterium CG10_big_fil_rev_8_21_14_0_10_48_16]